MTKLSRFGAIGQVLTGAIGVAACLAPSGAAEAAFDAAFRSTPPRAVEAQGVLSRLSLELGLGSACVGPGENIFVEIWMRDLDDFVAVGYQAFLVFDPGLVNFVGGELSDTPFPKIVLPITVTDNEIEMAAGVAGEPGTSEDTQLAVLEFAVKSDAACGFGLASLFAIDFRPAGDPSPPPSRITDDEGVPIEATSFGISCTSIICPEGCPADIDLDGGIGFTDLVALLASWGSCDDPDDCPADFNGDLEVDFFDLLFLLSSWGRPCPVGACCLIDGSCTQFTVEQCAAAGGVYAGTETTCEDTDCP